MSISNTASTDSSLHVTAPPSPAQHAYTAYYCEENVYHLLRSLPDDHLRSSSYAVFVSNPDRACLLFHQKASGQEQGYVIWDYHVIALVPDAQGSVKVWDLDSDLGLEVDFEEYVLHTFRPDLYGTPERQEQLGLNPPRFRIVPADLLLAHFASDRSHMLPPGTASEYVKPLPPWPSIQGEQAAKNGEHNNLWTRYLHMTMEGEAGHISSPGNNNWEEGAMYGRVLPLQDFLDFRALARNQVGNTAALSEDHKS